MIPDAIFQIKQGRIEQLKSEWLPAQGLFSHLFTGFSSAKGINGFSLRAQCRLHAPRGHARASEPITPLQQTGSWQSFLASVHNKMHVHLDPSYCT